MSPQDAKKIKLGTAVVWESSGERGTVTGKGPAGLRVQWDDGTDTVYLYTVTGSGLLHVKKA